MGFFFIFMLINSLSAAIFRKFPSPMGIFFISIEFTRDAMVLAYAFPSPMGIFFISILSYGNLSGHRENLHFAVQKVFSDKIRSSEAF